MIKVKSMYNSIYIRLILQRTNTNIG